MTDRAGSLRQQILQLTAELRAEQFGPKDTLSVSQVPVSGKVIDVADLSAVVDSALAGWSTTGRWAREFDRKLERLVGAHSASLVNSRSSASLVALSVLSSRRLGANCEIDVTMLETARSEKTRAVMIAQMLEDVFDLEAVTAFCKKYSLWLIEDCCDALGSTWKGRKVATFGDIATLSFYPAHHIAMGDAVQC